MLAFKLDAMPPNAQITGIQLRIYKTDAYKGRLTVRVVAPRCTNAAEPATCTLSSAELQNAPYFSSSESKAAWDAFSCRKGDAGCEFLNSLQNINSKYLVLALDAGDSKTAREYAYTYSGEATPGNETAVQPRLVVTFTLPNDQPSALSDFQSDGVPAVRAGMMKIGNPSQQPTSVFSNGLMAEPVMYKSFPVAVRNRDGGLHLELYSSDGNLSHSLKVSTPELPVPVVPEAVLVASDRGQFSLIAGQYVIIYQVDQIKGVIDRIRGTKLSWLPRVDAAVAAPNGDLYITGGGKLYGLNAALQLLWTRAIAIAPNPRMTLSPGVGDFLYVATVAQNGGGSLALTAINVHTGTPETIVVGASVPVAIQQPVVVRHQDGADFIFLGANSVDTGNLFAIKNEQSESSRSIGDSAVGDAMASLEMAYNIPGLAGQPILDDKMPGDLSEKYFYYVQRPGGGSAQLMKIRCLDGQATVAAKVQVSDDIWSRGNPVMDPARLFLRTGNTVQIFWLSPFRTAGTVDAKDWRLLMGERGTLFQWTSQHELWVHRMIMR